MSATSDDTKEDVKVFDEKMRLELSLAQMETRLREMVTNLMQPTIAKTTAVLEDLDGVKAVGMRNSRGIQELKLSELKAHEQVAQISSFRDDMVKWDNERRGFECQVEDQLKALQQKLEDYKYSLDQKESVIHHMNRNIDRSAMEVNNLARTQEASATVLEGRIDEQSRAINKAKAETEVQLAALEIKIHAMTDELWGEQAGLAKVAGELSKAQSSFADLEASIQSLREAKAEIADLNVLRGEISKVTQQGNSAVTSMARTVGNVVNDVKEHFRTASDAISRDSAMFIGDMRRQHHEEIEKVAILRREVAAFVEEVEKSVEEQDSRLQSTFAKASALAAETREEIEEMNRWRKRDKNSADNEIGALKKRLGGVFDNFDGVQANVDHLSEAVQTIIESLLIGSSLDMQDTADKQKIALLGVKDDETMHVRSHQKEPQRPRPECRVSTASTCTRGAGGARSIPAHSQEPVVKVKGSCVSCSGQSPLILSAFKMACLQYAPSPVEYDGFQHDRSDLLTRRHELLHRCNGSFAAGAKAADGKDDSNGFDSYEVVSTAASTATGEMIVPPSPKGRVRLPSVSTDSARPLTVR